MGVSLTSDPVWRCGPQIVTISGRTIRKEALASPDLARPPRNGQEEVGVRFLTTPASPQGVSPYTVLFTCELAGPEQAPKWGHVVMAGVL